MECNEAEFKNFSKNKNNYREICLLNRIKDKHIIPYYGYYLDSTNNSFCIVMKYCKVSWFFSNSVDSAMVHLSDFNLFRYIRFEYKNGDLRKQIDSLKNSKKSFADSTILQWSEELLKALQYLENNDIVHNDIKPE